jgi:hypothetical protein
MSRLKKPQSSGAIARSIPIQEFSGNGRQVCAIAKYRFGAEFWRKSIQVILGQQP